MESCTSRYIWGNHKRFLSELMKDDIFTIHSATTEQGLGANIQLRALKGLEHTWLQRPFSKLKKYSFCLFQQLDRESQLQEKDWPTCVCNYSTRLQVQQGLSGNSFIFLLFPVGGRPAVQRAPTGFSLEPIYHWKIKKKVPIIWCWQEMSKKSSSL